MAPGDPLDAPVITRSSAERHVGHGGPTMFAQARAAGVIQVVRTVVGREYITPRDFAALVRFSERQAQR